MYSARISEKFNLLVGLQGSGKLYELTTTLLTLSSFKEILPQSEQRIWFMHGKQLPTNQLFNIHLLEVQPDIVIGLQRDTTPTTEGCGNAFHAFCYASYYRFLAHFKQTRLISS
jgi:hypothetical protein